MANTLVRIRSLYANELFMMGKSCCAVGCSNRYSKGCGLQFYRFPRDPERRRQWIASVNRKNWEPTEHSWICSSHFIGGNKSNEPTSPAHNPSIFDHIKSPKKRKAEEDLRRFSRLKECKRRRIETLERERIGTEERQKERDEAEEIERLRYEAETERERLEAEERSEAGEALLELSRVEMCCSFSTMTEVTLEEFNQVEKAASEKATLVEEIDRLKAENAILCKQIVTLKQALITPESLMDSDAKVKYYTGIPSYDILKAIFDFVFPCIKSSSRTVLPLFNQFLPD